MGLCGSTQFDVDEHGISANPPSTGTNGNGQLTSSTAMVKVAEKNQGEQQNGQGSMHNHPEPLHIESNSPPHPPVSHFDHSTSSRSHSHSRSRSRSHSRSRSRSRRKKKRRHQPPDPIQPMDAIGEEQRNILEDRISYKPPMNGTNGAAGLSPIKQSFISEVNVAPSSTGKSTIVPTQQGASVESVMHASMADLDCVVVLVCDEDESIQTCLEKWLSQDRKYQIVPCCSGDEVIEVLASSELEDNLVTDISFIIADGNMTTPTGEQLLDWIKNDPATAQIPSILMCPEGTSTQATDRLIRRGASDVLHKPLNKVSLLNSIDTMFRTKMDEMKIDVLRDKGDEYKQELLRERRRNSKDFGSMKHPTLSPFTVSEDNLEAIHVLLIDDQSTLDSTSGQMVLSTQARKIQEWIGSMILNIVVAHSCERGIEIMDEMASSLSLAASHLNSTGASLTSSPLVLQRRLMQQQMNAPPGGTIQRALGIGGDDSLANNGNIISAGLKPYRPTLFGVELIIFDFNLLERGTLESRLLIQRILNQQQVIPIVILIDDISDVSGEYLTLLKNCSVTFIQKPLSSETLSKKIGLIVESIQSHRQKQRFAYRAAAYRLMLQRLRERKKTLGLTNKDTLRTPSIGSMSGNSTNSDRPHGQVTRCEDSLTGSLNIGSMGEEQPNQGSLRAGAHRLNSHSRVQRIKSTRGADCVSEGSEGVEGAIGEDGECASESENDHMLMMSVNPALIKLPEFSPQSSPNHANQSRNRFAKATTLPPA